MKNLYSSPGGRRRLLPTWLTAAMLGAGFSLSAGITQAAMPPAGTQIGNQALASFIDAAKIKQETKSNNVITVVSQVGSLDISKGNSKVGIRGANVYAQHFLKNNGNGTETFSITIANTGTVAPLLENFSLYEDTNGTGVPAGAALCGPTSAKKDCTDVQLTLAPGVTRNLIVEYPVPGNAKNDWLGKASVTVSPSPALVTAHPHASYVANDEITIGSGAAFELTKQIGGNLPKAPAGGNWPTPITSSEPSVEGSVCTLAWPIPADAASKGCHYTTYTINFENKGVAKGRLLFIEPLPEGLTIVKGSAVFSKYPGKAIEDGVPADTYFSVINGQLTFATELDVQGVGYSAGRVSFAVLVNDKASVDTPNTTVATKYGTASCQGNTLLTSCAPAESNLAEFKVNPQYQPVVSSALTATTPDALGSSHTNPGANNIVAAAEAIPQNGRARFDIFVTNKGNAEDSFNLSVNNTGIAAHNFPPGTRFSFYKPDGATPLLDTNNDGIVDTGPLAPGKKQISAASQMKITVVALLPPDASTTNVPMFARVDAISTGALKSGGSKTDSVWLTIDTVTLAAVVDLTNTADGADGSLGPGPGASPTYLTQTKPGEPINIPLFIKNNHTKDLTFKLMAAPGTAQFPGIFKPGWIVNFYPKGQVCPANDSAQTADYTVTVTGSQQQELVACVTPPKDQLVAPVKQSIYFRAESTTPVGGNQGIVKDTVYNEVTVNPAPSTDAKLLLTSEQSKQVAPGGSVTYSHSLSNVGDTSCKLNSELSNQSAGWNYSLRVFDEAGNEIATGSTTLPELASKKVWRVELKITAPLTATDKYIDKVKITFKDTDPAVEPKCGLVETVDETTVVESKHQLSLQKLLALDASCSGTATSFGQDTIDAKPGQCVLYRITGLNSGANDLTAVWINDMVPSFTTLMPTASGSCKTTGTGTVNFTDTSGNLLCGSNDAILKPGEKILMEFGIKLNDK